MNDFSSEFKSVLSHCALNGYASSDNIALFERLTDLLSEANARMNLTAIKTPEEIMRKHYADCLYIAHLFADGTEVLDVGCGGGFPSLPLSIVRRDLRITALDSTAKKLAFVAQAAEALHLHVQTLSGRAEELAKTPPCRERFDAATARALAPLPILLEWCLPFVKVGGRFVCMKGSGAKEELAAAKNALKTLGGSVKTLEERDLFGALRVNVVIEKTAHTPAAYPRRNSQIQKNPL